MEINEEKAYTIQMFQSIKEICDRFILIEFRLKPTLETFYASKKEKKRWKKTH